MPVVARCSGLAPEQLGELLAFAKLPSGLQDGTIIAPISAFRTFFWRLSCELDDRDFGARLAAAAPSGIYGWAEAVCRSAPSVDRGLVLLMRFVPLINSAVHFEWKSNVLHCVTAAPLGPVLDRFTYLIVRRIVEESAACSLSIRTPAPIDGRILSDESTHWQLRFTSECTRHRFPRHDPTVHDFLVARAAERLDSHASRGIAETVVDIIENRIGFRDASLESVAASIGISARSLQRRLADAGWVFRQILDERRAQSFKRLEDEGLALGDIQQVLGYSRLSTLRRATERWSAQEQETGTRS